jgi:hypothetical protein
VVHVFGSPSSQIDPNWDPSSLPCPRANPATQPGTCRTSHLHRGANPAAAGPVVPPLSTPRVRTRGTTCCAPILFHPVCFSRSPTARTAEHLPPRARFGNRAGTCSPSFGIFQNSSFRFSQPTVNPLAKQSCYPVLLRKWTEFAPDYQMGICPPKFKNFSGFATSEIFPPLNFLPPVRLNYQPSPDKFLPLPLSFSFPSFV